MASPPRVWKKGDRVDITYLGRIVTGRIEVASENGVALMLAFEALLGGFAGHMPVMWKDTEYRDIILGAVVGITEPATQKERLQA